MPFHSLTLYVISSALSLTSGSSQKGYNMRRAKEVEEISSERWGNGREQGGGFCAWGS